MVAVTATTDANGNYVAKDSTVELKAKGSTNHVDKEADDKFVKAGDVVPFTITTTVPYNVNEFKVFDKQLNLQAPTDVVVKVAGETKTGFSFDEGVVGNDSYTTYTMDLSSLVYANDKKINDNAGATVVITYNAVVVGADGFVNEAYDSTNGNHKTVTGITAHITLAKLDQDGKAITGTTDDAVAEFEVTDSNNKKLTFKLENGVYVLSDAQDANATVKTDKTTGKVTVAGLEEGTYHFTETKAPKGYSINPLGASQIVAETDTATEGTRVVPYNITLNDSTLISLPFTGGMGTTIFTILGVAIMAMAAALFFATKKSR
jgi:fimbrial isopeptide formation D2 family protein/LPXTG-motif cell wall-anchored protein